jgi:hypothetical protein
MKKLILPLIVAVGLIGSASAQTTQYNFTGNTVDPTQWDIILPQWSSAIIQNNGSLTLAAGASISTTASFSTPISISGSFSLSNDLDLLNIIVRSNGQQNQGLGLWIRGSAQAGGGQEISLYYASVPNFTLIYGSYMPIYSGQSYTYDINDLGSSYSLSLNGSLIFTAAVDPTYTQGDKILFGDGQTGGTATLSPITVTAVPEPSTYALFGLGALALVVAYRRKVA